MSSDITRITIQPEAQPPPFGNLRKPASVGNFSAEDGAKFIGEGGFLSALIDIINPLQHIPVISTIYRQITGDTIAPAARVLGGALMGGPLGLIAGIADAAAATAIGKDIGQQVASIFTNSPAEQPEAKTQIAQNDTQENQEEDAVQTAANPAAIDPASIHPLPVQAKADFKPLNNDNTAAAKYFSLSGAPITGSSRAQHAATGEEIKNSPAQVAQASAKTNEEPLFYPSPTGKVEDWYHDTTPPPAKKAAATRAYNKMQLLPIPGLAVKS